MNRARWRLLFWAAAAFAFVMAVLPHPPRLPGEPNDKVQHVIAFATLAMLGQMAFGRALALRLLLGLSLFGAMIELVQLYRPLNRDGDIVDWLADTLAVAVVLGLARLIKARAPPPPSGRSGTARLSRRQDRTRSDNGQL